MLPQAHPSTTLAESKDENFKCSHQAITNQDSSTRIQDALLKGKERKVLQILLLDPRCTPKKNNQVLLILGRRCTGKITVKYSILTARPTIDTRKSSIQVLGVPIATKVEVNQSKCRTSTSLHCGGPLPPYRRLSRCSCAPSLLSLSMHHSCLAPPLHAPLPS